MTSVFYFVFVALAFTPEILALFGFTLFKDPGEALVGKYLLDQFPKLKLIDFTPPRWLALSWLGCAIYSAIFMFAFQKLNYLLNGSPELRALVLLPVALCAFPLLIGQMAAFAMLSRIAILWAVEQLPRYTLATVSKSFLFFLALIRRL